MGALSEATATRLVDLFQSSAFGLTAWDTALSALADASGASVGQLAILDDRGEMFVNICSGVGPDDIDAYLDHGGPDPAINLRTRAVIAAPVLKTLVEGDYTNAGYLARDPFYNDFFLPRDLPFSCLTKLFHDGGGMAGVSLLRSGRSGHADEATRAFLDQVMPRIAEAVRGSLSLARVQAGTLATLASHVHGNVVLLGADAQIRHMSIGAEAQVRSGTHLSARNGRLHCADPRSQPQLLHAIRALSTAGGTMRRLHVPLPLPDRTGCAVLAAELVALPAPVHAGLIDVAAMLVLPDPPAGEGDAAAALDGIRRRYGLTTAEAAVCAMLASGADARQIADRRGSSVGTVRNQIKVAFEKTGTRRQLDLILRLRQDMRAGTAIR